MALGKSPATAPTAEEMKALKAALTTVCERLQPQFKDRLVVNMRDKPESQIAAARASASFLYTVEQVTVRDRKKLLGLIPLPQDRQSKVLCWADPVFYGDGSRRDVKARINNAAIGQIVKEELGSYVRAVSATGIDYENEPFDFVDGRAPRERI